jgi:excisionase family DNA binding protein
MSHHSAEAVSSHSQGLGAKAKNFAPILLPRTSMVAGDRLVGVQSGDLLSVREVARMLRVCDATVYRLCEQGVLPHVRILNAVRVAPETLAAFVEQGMIRSRKDRQQGGQGPKSPRVSVR